MTLMTTKRYDNINGKKRSSNYVNTNDIDKEYDASSLKVVVISTLGITTIKLISIW